jgi:hypothetical protein
MGIDLPYCFYHFSIRFRTLLMVWYFLFFLINTLFPLAIKTYSQIPPMCHLLPMRFIICKIVFVFQKAKKNAHLPLNNNHAFQGRIKANVCTKHRPTLVPPHLPLA